MTRFLRDESGGTAVEYAVIAGLIFLAIIAAIVPIGASLTGMFNDVVAGFN